MCSNSLERSVSQQEKALLDDLLWLLKPTDNSDYLCCVIIAWFINQKVDISSIVISNSITEDNIPEIKKSHAKNIFLPRSSDFINDASSERNNSLNAGVNQRNVDKDKNTYLESSNEIFTSEENLHQSSPTFDVNAVQQSFSVNICHVLIHTN